MSRKYRKTEGGHTRGHSMMNHWMPSAEVKAGTRTERRRQDKESAAEGLAGPESNTAEVVRPNSNEPKEHEDTE